MAEVRIIAEVDIREFYPQLSVNVSDDKIESAILQSQQVKLESFLGYYLYNAFIEDYAGNQTFNTTAYQTLFDGGSYTHSGNTRYFRGVRHLLACYSFARLLWISDVNLTESGMVTKDTEESDPQESFKQRNAVRQIRDDIVRLEKDNKDFIESNKSDYMLYYKRYATDDYKTSYNFIRV